MKAVHVFVPRHGSGVTQLFGEVVHEKVQSASHPVPMPFCAPKSHCSGDSTTPSPQFTEMQLPALQTSLVPQVVPSATGRPGRAGVRHDVHVPWVDAGVRRGAIARRVARDARPAAVGAAPHARAVVRAEVALFGALDDAVAADRGARAHLVVTGRAAAAGRSVGEGRSLEARVRRRRRRRCSRPAQVSMPLQGLRSSQRALPLRVSGMQKKLQCLSQPGPPSAPGSHCSPRLTTPSPQTAGDEDGRIRAGVRRLRGRPAAARARANEGGAEAAPVANARATVWVFLRIGNPLPPERQEPMVHGGADRLNRAGAGTSLPHSFQEPSYTATSSRSARSKRSALRATVQVTPPLQ